MKQVVKIGNSNNRANEGINDGGEVGEGVEAVVLGSPNKLNGFSVGWLSSLHRKFLTSDVCLDASITIISQNLSLMYITLSLSEKKGKT